MKYSYYKIGDIIYRLYNNKLEYYYNDRWGRSTINNNTFIKYRKLTEEEAFMELI